MKRPETGGPPIETVTLIGSDVTQAVGACGCENSDDENLDDAARAHVPFYAAGSEIVCVICEELLSEPPSLSHCESQVKVRSMGTHASRVLN
jgi:hypothetical protein